MSSSKIVTGLWQALSRSQFCCCCSFRPSSFSATTSANSRALREAPVSDTGAEHAGLRLCVAVSADPVDDRLLVQRLAPGDSVGRGTFPDAEMVPGTVSEPADN